MVPRRALTPAEREALRLRAHGLTYREIGTRTGRAENTVNQLLHRAFVKLDAQNSTEAFIALGWLTPPEA